VTNLLTPVNRIAEEALINNPVYSHKTIFIYGPFAFVSAGDDFRRAMIKAISVGGRNLHGLEFVDPFGIPVPLWHNATQYFEHNEEIFEDFDITSESRTLWIPKDENHPFHGMIVPCKYDVDETIIMFDISVTEPYGKDRKAKLLKMKNMKEKLDQIMTAQKIDRRFFIFVVLWNGNFSDEDMRWWADFSVDDTNQLTPEDRLKFRDGTILTGYALAKVDIPW
jgi:hypothetical protein